MVVNALAIEMAQKEMSMVPAFSTTVSSHDLVPTGANGQPAFGVYLRAPTGGIRHGTGLFVLTLAGDRSRAMIRFDSSVLRWFGLPQSLAD